MPLTVAAAQPEVVAGDLHATVAAHAAAVEQAAARLVVFPELSLTGYELEAPTLAPESPALAPLVEACARAGSVALVGAPVRGEAGDGIAVLAVSGDGVVVAYRKVHLGAEERRRFVGGTTTGVLELDGRRVGLGVCRDTGQDAHVAAIAAAGIDLYAAGVVHAPEELEEQERRGRRIAAATSAPVVLASFAGPTGGGYAATAGHSAIWAADGRLLARADALPGRVVRAAVP